jgi:hypothetical protein
MRILDEARDAAIANITLLLTRAEASEMRDALETLLADESRHEHVSSKDYDKEVSLAIYNDETLQRFNDRCRRLIRQDK